MYEGIGLVKPGVRLGDIGFAIQTHAEKHFFSVVEEFCGHGIGKVFTKITSAPLWTTKIGYRAERGITFTIEPMINQGKRYRILADGWTAVTKDRKLSAQWEHTILVTATGYEILTYREGDESFPRAS